ncbi:cell division cycle protein 20 homolog B-like isoform X2 [Mugil cephalus]|uniref:cell division cycle protein 20 homolog B-like isoform X2 n=1 Tax=Mugil cephalus TaxID=48193 RepID=UPI001FB61626|nr:cell division cycle protein 20 homolog B-like isoform X2 [Mugil cephalus]
MLGDFVGRRRHCPFKGQYEVDTETYKRFRRRIIQRSHGEGPCASTPVAPRWRCEPRFKLDSVCQRLELDSPPRHHEPEQRVLQGAHQEAVSVGRTSHGEAVLPPNTPRAVTVRRHPVAENVTEQGLVWRAGDQEHENAQCAGCDERGLDLKPFAVLHKSSGPGGSATKLLAPSLLNDYYTNLLDCSCNGMIALALGSSVYLWNSETRALVGHLEPGPQPGRPSCQTRSISCLCWSRDGRALCIGTRRGEIQLWDVEHKQNMRRLPSHMSVVGALSWKQQLLSSGSVLGHIHHLDPRAPAALVGSAVQEEGICSLQWSPGGERLASGSTGGLLHIWDSHVAGVTKSRQPITTAKQTSAVKAMGWCPWQGDVIATGGGWKDGELRIWDTQSGSCVTSVNTNSQICSLRWADRRRHLITGHGLPHHQVTCWQFPSLSPIYQLTGHSQRVLHLATNPDNTQLFSAGADQCFHVWDL